MRILLAASEAFPFCKTGGLADVIGTLSQKLGAAGHDVVLFLPKYRSIEAGALQGGMAYPLDIPLGAGCVQVWLRYMQWRSVSVQFIDCPPLFDREGLYGVDGRDHPDNDVRYAVFSRAVLEGAKAMGFKPDIVHLHDWQTALGAVYLKTIYRRDPFFSGTASVLTVHNIAYQGSFPAQSLVNVGFKRRQFLSAQVDAPCRARDASGRYSFLKAGLIHADWLTTVSPAYAREVQTAERGLGLETVLRRRRSRLQGILNGIDLDYWNPQKDSLLPCRFSIRDLGGKLACKKKFLADLGLRGGASLPLVGMVARLDRQKGWDMAMAVLGSRLGRCRFSALGEGAPALVAAVTKWAARHPGAARYLNGYHENVAHRLYAASDILLMPSRFEPCGLGQMIAMRYGCVPVVTRTGGLADTVRESEPQSNGFVAEPGDARDLGRTLDRALAAYQTAAWRDLMRAGMEGDFSWDLSVRRYVELYGRAVQKRRSAPKAAGS
ncbi:MAG TPA: glycogen synthase [Elusimicrobia bacterium]|nr:glycogen synthase [Elusimicrobiota bacterium]HBT60473.1 glycogen synthase [Elusimicrobiota bacterium]